MSLEELKMTDSTPPTLETWKQLREYVEKLKIFTSGLFWNTLYYGIFKNPAAEDISVINTYLQHKTKRDKSNPDLEKGRGKDTWYYLWTSYIFDKWQPSEHYILNFPILTPYWILQHSSVLLLLSSLSTWLSVGVDVAWELAWLGPLSKTVSITEEAAGKSS